MASNVASAQPPAVGDTNHENEIRKFVVIPWMKEYPDADEIKSVIHNMLLSSPIKDLVELLPSDTLPGEHLIRITTYVFDFLDNIASYTGTFSEQRCDYIRTHGSKDEYHAFKVEYLKLALEWFGQENFKPCKTFHLVYQEKEEEKEPDYADQGTEGDETLSYDASVSSNLEYDLGDDDFEDDFVLSVSFPFPLQSAELLNVITPQVIEEQLFPHIVREYCFRSAVVNPDVFFSILKTYMDAYIMAKLKESCPNPSL